MKKLEFQCCFCGDGIAETSVDPCAVVLIGNWLSPVQEKQAEQQFFCHVSCFKKAMWHNVPVDVESLVSERLEESDGAI